jgi:hypothetical protein
MSCGQFWNGKIVPVLPVKHTVRGAPQIQSHRSETANKKGCALENVTVHIRRTLNTSDYIDQFL